MHVFYFHPIFLLSSFPSSIFSSIVISLFIHYESIFHPLSCTLSSIRSSSFFIYFHLLPTSVFIYCHPLVSSTFIYFHVLLSFVFNHCHPLFHPLVHPSFFIYFHPLLASTFIHFFHLLSSYFFLNLHPFCNLDASTSPPSLHPNF